LLLPSQSEVGLFVHDFHRGSQIPYHLIPGSRVHFRSAEIRSAEVCSAEVCSSEVCHTEVCLSEVCPLEVRPLEVCRCEACLVEKCPAEIRTFEVCLEKIRTVEVDFLIGVLLPPRVKLLDRSLEHSEQLVSSHLSFPPFFAIRLSGTG